MQRVAGQNLTKQVTKGYAAKWQGILKTRLQENNH